MSGGAKTGRRDQLPELLANQKSRRSQHFELNKSTTAKWKFPRARKLELEGLIPLSDAYVMIIQLTQRKHTHTQETVTSMA